MKFVQAFVRVITLVRQKNNNIYAVFFMDIDTKNGFMEQARIVLSKYREFLFNFFVFRGVTNV